MDGQTDRQTEACHQHKTDSYSIELLVQKDPGLSMITRRVKKPVFLRSRKLLEVLKSRNSEVQMGGAKHGYI